jgi:hypothetical protein
MFYLYGIVHHSYRALTRKGEEDAESKEEFRDLMLMLINMPLLLNHKFALQIGRVQYAKLHEPTGELAVVAEIDPLKYGWAAERAIQDIRTGEKTYLSLGMMGAAQILASYGNQYAMNFVAPKEVSVVDDPGRGNTDILAFVDQMYIGLIPRGIKIPVYFRHNLNITSMSDVEKILATFSGVEFTDEQKQALEGLKAKATRGDEYENVLDKKKQKLMAETHELLDDENLFYKDLTESGELTEAQAKQVIASMKSIDVKANPGLPSFIRVTAARAGVRGAQPKVELESKLKAMQEEYDGLQTKNKKLDENLKEAATQTAAAATIEPKHTEKRWADKPVDPKLEQDHLDFMELAAMQKTIMAQEPLRNM